MPILYIRPEAKQEGGQFTEADKKLDQGVSRQSGKTVFVGPGLDAPMDETPQASQVYSYERIGTKGQLPTGRSLEEIKMLNPYYRRAKQTGQSQEQIADWTDQQFIEEAQGKLPKGQIYQQHAGRYFAAQPQQTDYTQHQYSTGQFYMTDRAGNVVPANKYPSGFQYNPNLVVESPALRGQGQPE
jgi:hypothetical protein